MSIIKQTIIDRSVPQYIKSEFPYFTSFVSAYYEWLEQQQYSIDITKNLKQYRDIDYTLDDFVQYFENEYINRFPKNILCDKNILIKNVREFYLNKGNQQSYKFLFRILFNEDVSFYFPGDDILRASDGKWQESTIIKIKIDSIQDISGLEDYIIYGKLSGASAGIESVISYFDRNQLIAEISINLISGAFVYGESVIINNVEFDSFGIYSPITITQEGSGYNVGDDIYIKDENNNIIGYAKVTKITKGPILSFTVTSPGIGYNGRIQTVTKFYPLPINHTWSSMYLPTTPIKSAGYDFSTLAINFDITTEVLNGTGDIVNVRDISTSSGYGAYGVISEVGNDGQIISASVVNGGNLYNSPTATIISSTGSGGVLDIIGGGGGVEKAKAQTFPIVLVTDTNNVYLDFTSIGDGNAEGTISTTITAKSPGFWLNEDSFLSSSKKLQDNYYYQDYSYVLKVAKSVNEWRDIVKQTIHPLGIAVFSQIEAIKNLNVSVEAHTYLTYITERNIDITVSVDSVLSAFMIDSNGDEISVLDSNGDVVDLLLSESYSILTFEDTQPIRV